MSKKKSENKNLAEEIKLRKFKPEDRLKYEIAEELGLLDKVLKDGWKGLTAKETGKIGGMVTKKKKELKEKELEGIEDTMKYEDSPRC